MLPQRGVSDDSVNIKSGGDRPNAMAAVFTQILKDDQSAVALQNLELEAEKQHLLLDSAWKICVDRGIIGEKSEAPIKQENPKIEDMQSYYQADKQSLVHNKNLINDKIVLLDTEISIKEMELNSKPSSYLGKLFKKAKDYVGYKTQREIDLGAEITELQKNKDTLVALRKQNTDVMNLVDDEQHFAKAVVKVNQLLTDGFQSNLENEFSKYIASQIRFKSDKNGLVFQSNFSGESIAALTEIICDNRAQLKAAIPEHEARLLSFEAELLKEKDLLARQMESLIDANPEIKATLKQLDAANESFPAMSKKLKDLEVQFKALKLKNEIVNLEPHLKKRNDKIEELNALGVDDEVQKLDKKRAEDYSKASKIMGLSTGEISKANVEKGAQYQKDLERMKDKLSKELNDNQIVTNTKNIQNLLVAAIGAKKSHLAKLSENSEYTSLKMQIGKITEALEALRNTRSMLVAAHKKFVEPFKPELIKASAVNKQAEGILYDTGSFGFSERVAEIDSSMQQLEMKMQSIREHPETVKTRSNSQPVQAPVSAPLASTKPDNTALPSLDLNASTSSPVIEIAKPRIRRSNSVDSASATAWVGEKSSAEGRRTLPPTRVRTATDTADKASLNSPDVNDTAAPTLVSTFRPK